MRGFLSRNATDAFSIPPTRQNRLCWALFVYYLDLFIDHLPGETIDCKMHPVDVAHLRTMESFWRLIAFGLS
jgi:hypothetical protein